MNGMEFGGKCLVLPVVLATVFIFFAILYISESYKGSIVIFSLVADFRVEQQRQDDYLLQILPSDIVNLIRACDRIAPLVLLDPRWLKCLSSNGAQSSTCFANRSSKPIRFAMITDRPSDSRSLIQTVMNTSRDIGWRQSKFYPSFDTIFLTKDNNSVAISVMELRRRYWYVHGTKDESARAFRGLNFTEFRPYPGNQSSTFLIPTPVDFYLWQWPRSRFIECNRSSSEYLKSRYPHIYAVPPVIKDSFVDILSYARDIFSDYRVTIMLAGGTALGWYRECGIIPHTTDTDMAFLAKEWKPEVEEVLRLDKTLSLYWILGRPEDGMEITVYSRGSKIDMFALYETANASFVGAMNVGEKMKLRWWYPKLGDVCTGDLKGELFFVRCDIVSVFVKEYGPQWYEHHHSKDYVWHSSHHNVQRVGVYSDREWPSVFRTFKYP